MAYRTNITDYILNKDFKSNKEAILELIDRIINTLTTLNIYHPKLREMTRFHISENINSFLINLYSEIIYLGVKLDF